MTDQIKRAQRVLDAATDGPWVPVWDGVETFLHVDGRVGDGSTVAGVMRPEDARAIGLMRNTYAELLAVAEAARAVSETLPCEPRSHVTAQEARLRTILVDDPLARAIDALDAALARSLDGES